jgi:hypothetical protein
MAIFGYVINVTFDLLSKKQTPGIDPGLLQLTHQNMITHILYNLEIQKFIGGCLLINH